MAANVSSPTANGSGHSRASNGNAPNSPTSTAVSPSSGVVPHSYGSSGGKRDPRMEYCLGSDPLDPSNHDPEECERLKPANGDGHCAYGSSSSAPSNDIHLLHQSHPSSPLVPKEPKEFPTHPGFNGSTATTPHPGAGPKRHSLILRRGDTDLSIDHGGFQRFLPKFMHFAFADREAEHLYQEYYSNEKRSDFKALIVIVVLVNVILLLLHLLACTRTSNSSIVTPSDGGSSLTHLLLLVCCLLCSIGLFVLCLRRSRDALASRLWAAIPFALWVVMSTQLVCDLWTFTAGRGPVEAGSGSLAWLLLYSYATYVIFPLRFRLCAALSLLMALLHTAVICGAADKQYKFGNQVGFPLGVWNF